MNLKKSLTLVAIIAAIVAVALFGQARGKTKEVTIEPLTSNIIKPSILASGTLAHEEEVRLSSEVIGKVSEVLVEEGDTVEAGQLVLKVDDQNFVAAAEQSKAQVRLSRIDIDRQKSRIANLKKQWQRKQKLFNQAMIGDDEFEALTHQLQLAEIDLKSSRERLRQAEAQLEQADERLSKTKITTPIKGVVTSLDIKVGETAIASSTNIPGSSLMTISNPSSIYTEVLVDEADVAGIGLGQDAEIVAIAYPDNPMTGRVRFIANTAKIEQGRQSLSFTVKIEITDSTGVILRPGMSCRAEIFTGNNQSAPTISLQAILVDEDLSTGSNTQYVFVMEDGIAKKRIVKTGLSDDQFQEVTSGVELGENIITGPANELRHLKDGDKVSIKVLNDKDDKDDDRASRNDVARGR